MRRLFIIDIDRTLSMPTKEREDKLKQEPKDWDGFFELCDTDIPSKSLNRIQRMIENSDSEDIVILLTGRPEKVRNKTREWIIKVGIEDWEIFHYIEELIMRKDGDYRHAPDFKLDEIERLLENDYTDITDIIVYDDDERVLEAISESELINDYNVMFGVFNNE